MIRSKLCKSVSEDTKIRINYNDVYIGTAKESHVTYASEDHTDASQTAEDNHIGTVAEGKVDTKDLDTPELSNDDTDKDVLVDSTADANAQSNAEIIVNITDCSAEKSNKTDEGNDHTDATCNGTSKDAVHMNGSAKSSESKDGEACKSNGDVRTAIITCKQRTAEARRSFFKESKKTKEKNIALTDF